MIYQIADGLIKVMLLIVQTMQLLIPLYFIYRWSKLTYYTINGRKTKGIISGEEKSNCSRSKKRNIGSYYVTYIFYDELGDMYKGRLDK